MAETANVNTLFHLVPVNDVAGVALKHPDNRRFVSLSAKKCLGLEVGFHVSLVPSRVLARLGRNADLILQKRNVSSVHVAFELHPDTLVVLLSVRAKHSPSVIVRRSGERERKGEEVQGDCVLVYGMGYKISIVDYVFHLEWQEKTPQSLRAMAREHYQKCLQLQANVPSRYLPTEGDSEVHTWHNTRVHTARRILFREAVGGPRFAIGQGQFGTVYRAIDQESGHSFAIKALKLRAYPSMEQARAVAHREVKTLEKLNHKHIIEFLGHDKWETDFPEIYMPLRSGNLRSLIMKSSRPWNYDKLTNAVLEQMLSALDHLAYHKVCHRDVKPDNILYFEDKDGHVFQLADFGLANHHSVAVTKCGTAVYEAPELYPEHGIFGQSPKMDVWSLFATIADIHPKYKFPPAHFRAYADALNAIRVAARLSSSLAPMAVENPNNRASAAQMLVALFDGRGLTTPNSRVPPIGSAPAAPVVRASVPANAPARALDASPLVKYPREPRGQLARPPRRLPKRPSPYYIERRPE